MSLVEASNFGHVRLEGNSNVKVVGGNNQGNMSDNSNLAVSSNNSNLNLSSNSNVDVAVENTTLVTLNCSNTEIRGSKIDATLQDNSNSKFNGNGNKWEAHSNSNLVIQGDNNKINAVGNSNANIEVDRGEVVAESNSNLNILGEGSKVVVKGTTNHTLKPVGAENGQINQLEIIPTPKSSFGKGLGVFAAVSSLFGTRNISSNRHSFNIDFVNEAEIAAEKYKLGIYQFQLKHNNRTNVHEVTFDGVGIDAGSLESRAIGGNEVLLSATNDDGVKQELRLKGPRVTLAEAGPTKKIFHVTSI